MGRTTLPVVVLTILCITVQGRLFGSLNLSASSSAETSSVSSGFVSTSGDATASTSSSGRAVARASAFSFAEGGEPTVAEATSTSHGPNAESEAVSVAKDGATVRTDSTAISDGEEEVKAYTAAEGEGPDTVIERSNTVMGIDTGSTAVELFVQKLKDGVNPMEASRELAAQLEKSKTTVITDGLASALELEGNISQVFTIAVENLLDRKGCDEFKKSFKGDLSRFLRVSVLSTKIDFCLFPACKRIESADSCCGEAQKHDPVCACGDYGCQWKQPSFNGPGKPFFWECDNCSEELSFCRCF